jgi:hypothetical protein
MTAATTGWPFFVEIVAVYAVLVGPAFAEMSNLPDLFHMAYCADADPFGLMLDVIKLDTFSENQDIPSRCTR